MPLREDILTPIPGETRAGSICVTIPKLLIHDKIKEARRQDDNMAQGDWQRGAENGQFPLVVKIAQDTLATVSKDLQVAAWLTEALLQTEGFGGLRNRHCVVPEPC